MVDEKKVVKRKPTCPMAVLKKMTVKQRNDFRSDQLVQWKDKSDELARCFVQACNILNGE